MKGRKDVTIYDIAKELNLSASTVSRALKDHYSIGQKTKKAVKKLAEEKGYRPNIIASSLRSKKTNTIGVIMPLINRPFISSLISGIEIGAKEAGYHVLISQSHDDYETEVANALTLYSSRVGGLIVSLAMGTKNYDHFRQFIRHNIPVVFVDRVTRELNSDLVVIDNIAAGFEATKHLIDQGCKRIAHIAGQQQRNVYRDRLTGYKEALEQHQMAIDENLTLTHNYLSFEDGYHCAEKLFELKDPPDGIFCANDTAAIGVIQYAKKHNIKIPEELAIIGFNNDPMSEIVDPPLSTIEHPAIDMGKLAAQQVLKLKEHSDIVHSESIVLRTKLIARASSNRKKI